MTARRLAIFVCIILVLGLAAAVIAPPPERGPDLTPPRTPATSDTARDADARTPVEEGVVTASLSNETPERESRVDAKVGDLVRIDVTSSKLDTVTLGELRTRAVEPGVPARFELTAAAAGSYPITLQGARTQVGTLVVTD